MSEARSFDQVLEELEGVTLKLSSDVTLEEQFEAFKQGTALAAVADEMLGSIERRVQIVTEEGLKPFEVEA